jgi:transposase InsO family protein
MDTHISDFRKIKYVHVTTDTFSGFPVATALTGEAAKNVISHHLHSFSMTGVPDQIKTDNGTGYYSQAFEMFCQQFNVPHVMGFFFNNSQGQGIVEL